MASLKAYTAAVIIWYISHDVNTKSVSINLMTRLNPPGALHRLKSELQLHNC